MKFHDRPFKAVKYLIVDESWNMKKTYEVYILFTSLIILFEDIKFIFVKCLAEVILYLVFPAIKNSNVAKLWFRVFAIAYTLIFLIGWYYVNKSNAVLPFDITTVQKSY